MTSIQVASCLCEAFRDTLVTSVSVQVDSAELSNPDICMEYWLLFPVTNCAGSRHIFVASLLRCDLFCCYFDPCIRIV